MKLAWLSRLPWWLRDGLPVVLWMALIFYLSSQPRLLEIHNEAGEKLFFKTAHATVYAVLTWLWWRILAPTRQPAWLPLLAAAGLAVLYGCTDEIHQLFVPGRNGQVADVLFDASGALLMVLLLRWLALLRTFPERLLVPFEGSGRKNSPKTIQG